MSLGYNLIGSQTGCTTISTDVVGIALPAFPLAGDGAPLPTRALVPPNPAINGGNPAGCTDHLGNLLPGDQRDMPRFGRCDIGAYELQPLGYSVKTSSSSAVRPRQSLTYTIALQNYGLTDIPSVRVTDTLPISLTYALGSLVATSGIAAYADGVITWTGTVGSGQAIDVTFGASVGPECGTIHNQAIILGGGETYTRSTTTQVIYKLFWPVITRAHGLRYPDGLSDTTSGGPIANTPPISWSTS